jgi:hypothetical protein
MQDTWIQVTSNLCDAVDDVFVCVCARARVYIVALRAVVHATMTLIATQLCPNARYARMFGLCVTGRVEKC